MAGAERRVSATEARVRFGELLDGVTNRHDVVSWNGDLLDVALALLIAMRGDARLHARARNRW